ncbi:membrane protein, putative [Thiobacillus denitrificans ATCC 25259]|uniref:Membrane protein, putative n=1 Tax=Thiobacillus denitrificans (strain ATCC 25259 / T1) TaxID=292415 RepID=Q3SHY8_THIDA|nr:exosortase B [Thiobacillus denitrificans]AAZ97745.1 membrane protein, putative [Thiobacillus denitrificans ATCC 25259]
MSTLATRAPAIDPLGPLKTWWPILLGLLVLYVPTYWMLAHGLWNSEEQAHGPIVLIVALFLIWQQRAVFVDEAVTPTRVEAATGWALLIVGLLAYALGRSQDILLFEVGSQIPVILGVLLITLGWRTARALWFALFFLLFMIPLPGFVVDAATGPLKQYISVIAEQVLYAAGYPIARSGVTLTVGQYQLLVADACSGLHSMFSLTAMGLLYLYLMQRTSIARNLIIMAAILPMAFLANVVRVMVLILVTYHLGDEAGQGFLHGFAGIMLFIVGLLFLFLLDALLGFVFPDRPRVKAKA